jgi:hypothetical protein
MKETDLTQAISDVIEEDIPIWEQFFDEYIAPLGVVGTPEAVLGKKYEEWTPQDIQVAASIFPDEIEDFLAKKMTAELYELEKEVP